MTIGVVGLWHLGEVYSICLSKLGHNVIGFSNDKQVVKDLSLGRPPVVEPQLDGLLRAGLADGQLRYSNDFRLLNECNVVWLTLDTPINNSDKANTTVIMDTLKMILSHLSNDVLILISSQLPVGTSHSIINYIKKYFPQLRFTYAYIPENLRLGEAVNSFFHPGRIVIGADKKETHQKIISVFRNLKTDFLIMSLTSAEMVKHALNSFLATSLSFIYDIADVCEIVGADILDISRALRSDPRIGPKAYLDASIGFSGGTLARDLQYLLATAKKHQLNLPVIAATLTKNTYRKKILLSRLTQHLHHLEKKKIAIYGLTYKAGTNTLRRSLAIEVAKQFSRLGAHLNLCDPHLKVEDITPVLKNSQFTFHTDPYLAVQSCHAVVIITPWDELNKLNFKKLRQQMKSPAVFFDARNYFSRSETTIRSNGFTYLGIGR